MKRKRRARRILVLITSFLLLMLFSLMIRHRLSPIIREMAMTRVSNEASFAINRAILRQIRDENIHYEQIVLLEKDVQGRICAIKTNMAEINRLQAHVLSIVDEEVLELSVEEIGIPVGNLFLPEIFSGKGPHLPVRVIAVSTSDAEFSSHFSEAGINQTLHRILLTVTASMTVLTLTGTQTVKAETSMIVAETVIIGSVPQTYLQANSST